MEEKVDLLKIKIEEAKRNLPPETVRAIDEVDWRGDILKLREKRGFSIEQLSDLETETELLLCGLVKPEDYPRELESRMNISRRAAEELVREMNDQSFRKIREALIKNTESERAKPGRTIETPSKIESEEASANILKSAGIEIVEKNAPEVLPLSMPMRKDKKEVPDPSMVKQDISRMVIHPLMTEKLSTPVQIPTAKTEHSLNNMTKNTPSSYPQKADPYRLSPDE